MKKLIALFVVSIIITVSFAQQLPGNVNLNALGSGSSGPRKDSIAFVHRDDAKDSITIHYKFLDSTRNIALDHSINDFSSYFAVPFSLQFLGNDGSAGYSLIYQPLMKPGWDDGFHAFDAYRYTLEDSKFFKTTKPLSQVAYQLASGAEQTVKVLHAQSPKPNVNFGFEYKLVSAPGFFVTQNNNINSYRAFADYRGVKKRYAAYFILVGNTIKAAENGGITNDSLLSNPDFSQRFTIPTNLGGAVSYAPSPFNSTITTGNNYNDFTAFLRQTYDFGKNDSLDINDSTTEYLFYPKLRLQYSFSLTSNSHQFIDGNVDSTTYANWYPTLFTKYNASTFSTYRPTAFSLTAKSNIIVNDFSMLQFPDTKNQSQFFLEGIRLENIKTQGSIVEDSFSAPIVPVNYYNNIILHGEYRNRTRNKLWDFFARGEIYLEGFNSGDYDVKASLARYLGQKLGNINLAFENVNKSPSYIYNPASPFNFGNAATYAKENITAFKATLDNPFIHLDFADYFMTNYTYFSDYYHTAQDSKLINLLQLTASKKIKLTKHINWYADITVQQTDNSAPIKVPVIFTRNRIAYEGTFYQNLHISTGLEFRYYTPYKEYNYSPIEGQFMPQDTVTEKNLPDISAFLHFNIRTFSAYIRADNLNSVSFSNGFGFTNNNFAAPHYAYPGFIFRVGVQWNFIN
jgi:putative beta-barrel porin